MKLSLRFVSTVAIAFGLIFGGFVAVPASVGAQTVAELQAQLSALMAQIAAQNAGDALQLYDVNNGQQLVSLSLSDESGEPVDFNQRSVTRLPIADDYTLRLTTKDFGVIVGTLDVTDSGYRFYNISTDPDAVVTITNKKSYIEVVLSEGNNRNSDTFKITVREQDGKKNKLIKISPSKKGYSPFIDFSSEKSYIIDTVEVKDDGSEFSEGSLVVNPKGLRIGVLSTDDVPTAPQPNVNTSVTGAPSLSLKYNSANKEASLVSTSFIKVTAGSKDLYIPANSGVYTQLYMSGSNNPVTLNNQVHTFIAGSENDKVGNYYVVRAGSTGSFTTTDTFTANELFAGTYRSQTRVLYLTSLNSTNETVINTETSNAITIIGERAPYISTVNGKTWNTNVSIKQGESLKLKGVRLAGAIFIDNVLLTETDATTELNITVPTTLSAGTHKIELQNNDGKSNIVWITVTTTTTPPVTPTITVLSPNGGEQIALRTGQNDYNNGELKVTWTGSNLKGDVTVYLAYPDGAVCKLGTATAQSKSFVIVLGTNFTCSNIPRTITAGSYKIGLYLNEQTVDKMSDFSDNYFTITSAPIVVSPVAKITSYTISEVANNGRLVKWTASAPTTANLDIVCTPGTISFITDKNNKPSCEKGGIWAWMSPTKNGEITIYSRDNKEIVIMPLTLTLTNNGAVESNSAKQVGRIGFYPAVPAVTIKSPTKSDTLTKVFTANGTCPNYDGKVSVYFYSNKKEVTETPCTNGVWSTVIDSKVTASAKFDLYAALANGTETKVNISVSNPSTPVATTTSSVTEKYTVTVSATELKPGVSFSVSWTATGANLVKDWVGIFKKGANNQTYTGYKYTTGASGSVTFTAPTEAGEYEARYLKNDQYTSTATSKVFKVVVPQTTSSVGTSTVTSLKPYLTNITSSGVVGKVVQGKSATVNGFNLKNAAFYLDGNKEARPADTGASTDGLRLGFTVPTTWTVGTHTFQVETPEGRSNSISFTVTAAVSANRIPVQPIAFLGAVSAGWELIFDTLVARGW